MAPRESALKLGMTVDDENFRRRLLRRSALSLGGMLVFLAVIIFVPAGLRWWRGWLFLLVFCAFTVLSTAYLWQVNPDIFVARSKVHKGTKSWDKALLVIVLALFFATFATAGFDGRYGWSTAPAWVVVLGYVLFALGFAASTWVYAVNKFAEPTVRIQSERGHKVIDTGPYAIVRHPLYSASFCLMTGIPLAMGSYWALIPVAIGTVVIIVRTVFEDRVLQNELAGYKEYVSRVQYRLVPGIW
jgi:protein-S-isoprenylcysteine O-methyltransferase Ste14